MALRDEIQRAQQEALKGRQTEVLGTLRLLWSAIRTEEINERKELADEEILSVIARQVKQLSDALTDFTAGNRTDLMEKTKQEIELLQSYLPKQLTDGEIRSAIDRIILETGAATERDVGKVMSAAMKEMKGLADGNKVRQIVAEQLKVQSA